MSYADSGEYTSAQQAFESGSRLTYYDYIGAIDVADGAAPTLTDVANTGFAGANDTGSEVREFTYVIPDAGQTSLTSYDETTMGAEDIAEAKTTDGTARFINPDTGGNTPGYTGEYVSSALGGGTTNLGQDGYAPLTGTLPDASGTIGRKLRDSDSIQLDADGNPVSSMEAYVIPQGTPQTDGTEVYRDPNTGGGSPGTAGADQTDYVVGANSGTGTLDAALYSGVLASGTYTDDPGQAGQNGAVDGDTTSGLTYSVAYVIPSETYANEIAVPFRDPNTILSDTAGGGSPGSNPSTETYVKGAPGGGNNATGKGEGLVDGNPSSIVGGNNTASDNFSDVGYSEEYAIPFSATNDYGDPNSGILGQTLDGGGAAPGYQGSTVGQGRGTDLAIAEGVGYSEIYVIPFTVNDGPITLDSTSNLSAYIDPNTGGNAPGYQGNFVTGASDGNDSTTAVNENRAALEAYEIGTIWDGTGDGYVDPNNDADQTAARGSGIGDPSLAGNPGYETYEIPLTITGEGDQARVGDYIDPNTGGAAPGYAGDYVTGALGSGNAPSGEGNFGKGYSEEYIITSLTMVDPNTGGNAPGYTGDYVTISGNSDQTTLVNLTEEFLGDNTDAGKTTITEPSTTTKATIVTSIATRCTANC